MWVINLVSDKENKREASSTMHFIGPGGKKRKDSIGNFCNGARTWGEVPQPPG